MTEKKIIIVGAGTMGKDIARAFLSAGIAVIICDLPERLATIGGELSTHPLLVARTLDALTQDDLGRTEFVIEAVNEDMELKRKVWQRVGRLVPAGTICATNTSTLNIDLLAEALPDRSRFLGMHFFNPAHKMKLVEVIKGKETSGAAVEYVLGLCAALKKKPIVINNTPGFVVNRLLFAMLNEAFRMLEQGVAPAREIDEAMRNGAGQALGPFALADLIGIDVCYAILSSLQADLKDDKFAPSPVLKAMIGRHELGKKTGKGFYEYE